MPQTHTITKLLKGLNSAMGVLSVETFHDDPHVVGKMLTDYRVIYNLAKVHEIAETSYERGDLDQMFRTCICLGFLEQVGKSANEFSHKSSKENVRFNETLSSRVAMCHNEWTKDICSYF